MPNLTPAQKAMMERDRHKLERFHRRYMKWFFCNLPTERQRLILNRIKEIEDVAGRR